MQRLFLLEDGQLRMTEDAADLAGALWIDLLDPGPGERAAMRALGIAVPTLDEMREIEVSNRLYRDAGNDHMTAVLPGQGMATRQVAMPVAFILAPGRLVTVRFHRPRPFETFPARAGQSASGCGSAQRIFLGLVEEIVGRLADLIEGAGDQVDHLLGAVLGSDRRQSTRQLRETLQSLGAQGEVLGRVRLALLTLERAVSFHRQSHGVRDDDIDRVIAGTLRDIAALGEHATSVSTRLGFASDMTIGLITVEQNTAVRLFSVVAVLFMPPTLVASIYGMNFERMPELGWPHGYPLALGAMVISAGVVFAVFKWRHWL